MKRYLTIIIVFLFTFVIRVNAEDYETGELIKYKGIKFYVMEDKGEYLTLLKATPLTADEIRQYTDYFTSGNGDYYMGYLPYCKGDGEEEKCTFEDSNVKAALDSWSKQFGDNDLVADEVTYKEYDNNSSKNVTKSYKVRLLTKGELDKNFSYVHDKSNYASSQTYYSSLKTPKWITNYDYFLMDYEPIYNTSNYGYIGEGYASFGVDDISVNGITLSKSNISSLRPVINLSKKADIEKLKSPVKSINDSEFKIGDIVEYNGIEYYVIKDSNKNDKTVTLVKRMPLTKIEVAKYDTKYTSLGTQYYIYDEEDDSLSAYQYIPYYYREDGCSISYNDHGQCKNDYESSDIKKIVNMWADEHVNTSDLAKDETGYDIRIISTNDLTDNLGYASTVSRATIYDNYNVKIQQLHQAEGLPFNLMDCWTMTPVDGTNTHEYSMGLTGIYYNRVSFFGGGSVCPVITLNKKVASQENNSSNKVSIPDTLLKNPVFIVVIGIILIVVATVTVSLVIKRKNKYKN